MADEKVAAVWSWGDSGVRLNGLDLAFKQFTLDEFGQWIYALERANTVFETLSAALAKYENGQIDYTGACVRLRVLLDEYDKAARAVGAAARAIVIFFSDCDTKEEKFSALSAEELDRFVREALPILQERLAKPKAT